MKNDFVQLAAGVLVLVLGAAAEELLPHLLGIGFPFLLAAVLWLSFRPSRTGVLAFAVAAGAMEDALALLPPATSVAFFLAVAAVTRRSLFPRSAAVLVFPCYQLWLSVWVRNPEGGTALRLLLAVPFGLVALAAVGAFLKMLKRRAAIDLG